MGIMIFALSACGNGSAAENSSSEESSVSSEAQSTESQTSSEPESSVPETTETKALVVYFSWSGNTKAIAEEIAKQTGADIFEIVPVNAYSDVYETVTEVAQTERSEGARPEIEGTVDNFADYDIVYFGFPIWWGDMPMVMYTFLDSYDFSGKTVAVFASSASSGLGNTVDAIKEAEPEATVTEGLLLTGSTAEGAESKVSDWLSAIGQE